MEKPLNTFETLLEKYVFTVAAAVIDQLDSAQQDQLVNLMMSCNKGPIASRPPAEDENKPVSQSPRKGENKSVEVTLRTQWQAAVGLPGSGYVAYQQRQITIYQTHIDLMLFHIARLEKILEQAVENEVAPSSKSIRRTQHQTLQDGYILQVARLRAEQEKVRVQLRLYYESTALETGQ